jgi:pyruvate/2-oxoglutarate dehydrogenase complex dihydrolipoamide dehydrogenase (E3) component
MSERIDCDIAVIGAGAGGIAVATACALFGFRTVLIERSRPGGQRLYAELPLQALATAGRHATLWREAAGFGIRYEEPDIDFTAALRQAKTLVATQAVNETPERLAAFGIRLIQGEARFTARDRLVVGTTEITAKRFVIATGAQPALPPIPGLDGIPVLTPQSVFDLTERPLHLLVVGAGGAGFALAQAFCRIGVKVTLIDQGRFLARHDPELSDLAIDALRRDGATLHEQTDIAQVENTVPGIVLTLRHADGSSTRIAGSHLLLAAGWHGDHASLDPAAAGVTTGPRGIVVDRRLRSANPRILAIGAAIDNQATTPVVLHHAAVAAKNLVFRLPARIDRDAAASLVACDPELAAIGLTEAEARRRHGSIRILRRPFAMNERATADGRSEGLVKVVTTPFGRILGAVAIGPQAAEVLQPWALAIGKELGVGAMQGMVAPFPARGNTAAQAATDFFRPRLFSPLGRRIVQFLARFD